VGARRAQRAAPPHLTDEPTGGWEGGGRGAWALSRTASAIIFIIIIIILFVTAGKSNSAAVPVPPSTEASLCGARWQMGGTGSQQGWLVGEEEDGQEEDDMLGRQGKGKGRLKSSSSHAEGGELPDPGWGVDDDSELAGGKGKGRLVQRAQENTGLVQHSDWVRVRLVQRAVGCWVLSSVCLAGKEREL
jgi:hypothetical protein